MTSRRDRPGGINPPAHRQGRRDMTMGPEARLLLRRRFLQLAGGTLGLHLGGLWRARAAAPAGVGSIRSCILIFYYGGPSHLDTYDPKPDAPAEVRGEFRTIPTTV